MSSYAIYHCQGAIYFGQIIFRWPAWSWQKFDVLTCFLLANCICIRSRQKNTNSHMKVEREARSEVLLSRIFIACSKAVDFDEKALSCLVKEILNSRKWKFMFGSDTTTCELKADKLLEALVKEYKDCKVKETNAVIRSQRSQLKQAINISKSKHSSSIALQGNTPETFKTRIEAAKSLGRVNSYSAERRRLLSIVALTIQSWFTNFNARERLTN